MQSMNIELVAIVLGTTASVATAGIVIFLFRRVFQTVDKLASAVDDLSTALNELKLHVYQQYVGIETCKDCREKCEHWKNKMEAELQARGAEAAKGRQEIHGRVTKLETKMSMHCPNHTGGTA